MNITTIARSAILGLTLLATPALAAPTCSNDVPSFKQTLTANGYTIVGTGTTTEGETLMLAMGKHGHWILLLTNGKVICVLSTGRGALALNIPGSPA